MPFTNLPARITIRTFNINKKIPSVRIVMGSVKITRMGFTIAFKIPSTSTNIRAVEKLFISTCGLNIIESPYATAAVTRRRIINFISTFFESYFKLLPIQKNLQGQSICWQAIVTQWPKRF